MKARKISGRRRAVKYPKAIQPQGKRKEIYFLKVSRRGDRNSGKRVLVSADSSLWNLARTIRRLFGIKINQDQSLFTLVDMEGILISDGFRKRKELSFYVSDGGAQHFFRVQFSSKHFLPRRKSGTIADLKLISSTRVVKASRKRS